MTKGARKSRSRLPRAPLFMIGMISLLASAPLRAEDSVTGGQDDIAKQAQACIELVQTIRHSDCGNSIYRWFDGGFVSLGASWYSLSMKATIDTVEYAEYMGETMITPHYAITTRPNYFNDSNFGYEYSFGIVQAYTTVQGINANGKRVAKDLGTYVVASMYSVQANLFYAIGAHDDTPRRYFRGGIGMGVGYADIKGKLYETEQQTTSNPACAQAVDTLGKGDDGALAGVRQNCPYNGFNRYGVGFSARILLEGRINAWLITVQTSVVNLPSKAGLVWGKGSYDFNPTATYATLAYLFDL